MNKRQAFALEHPYHSLRDKMIPGYHREIGKFSTLLTIDLHPDFVDMSDGIPEWHASAGLNSKAVLKELGPLKEMHDRGNIPMVNMLIWSEKAWMDAIKLCHAMLVGVGDGNGYWTGEGASLHYRRRVTKDELARCSTLALSIRR